MTYPLIYSCGHRATDSDLKKWTPYIISTRVCPPCYFKAQSTPEAPQMPLPALSGSDRQIAWATSIRAAKVSTVAHLPHILKVLVAHTEAVWWIQNRELEPHEMVNYQRGPVQ